MVGKTISHYCVLRRLGGGGMGEVYEAVDVSLGRHVAIKFLKSALAQSHESVLRFEREARAGIRSTARASAIRAAATARSVRWPCSPSRLTTTRNAFRITSAPLLAGAGLTCRAG